MDPKIHPSQFSPKDKLPIHKAISLVILNNFHIHRKSIKNSTFMPPIILNETLFKAAGKVGLYLRETHSNSIIPSFGQLGCIVTVPSVRSRGISMYCIGKIVYVSKKRKKKNETMSFLY